MGNCASNTHEADGKARSDMIDRQIEEDSKRYKRECKILLLGASPISFLAAKSKKEKEKNPWAYGPYESWTSTGSSFDISHVTGSFIYPSITTP